jgi:hypothetical protein
LDARNPPKRGSRAVIVVENDCALDYSGAVATASTQLLNQAFNGRFESIRRRQHLQSEAAEHLDTEPVQLRQ